MSSNPDLINSCRVCRHPNQDDADYECLFEEVTTNEATSPPTAPALSNAGRLYDSLVCEITPETYDYYPRYLCNSCCLQMKLFKKLRDKALNTLKMLEGLYEEDVLPQKEEKLLSDDEEVYNEEQITIEDLVEEENVSVDASLKEVSYISTQTEICIKGESENVLSEGVFLIPVSIQKTTINETDPIQLNPTNEDMKTEEDEAISEAAELAHCAGLDKSDYVLEIYKVLDDGATQTTISQSEADTNDLENYVMEDNLGSQIDESEEQCLDRSTLATSEGEELREISKIRSKIGIPIHEKNKMYSCTECSELFSCSRQFKHHKTYVHVQTYACKVCSTILKSSRGLATHMKLHDKNPAYSCEMCQKTFSQKAHFEYHMNRHNNIRQFQCDQCEKAFLTKSDLRSHQRRHNTNYRPHVCHTCGKSYISAEHLRTHALKHTNISFRCDHCPQQFANPKTLRQHVSSIHAAEPRFKCEICMKPFRRKHHLQYHMRLHPGYNSNYERFDIDNPDEMSSNVDDEDDIIKDPGFVALDGDTILM
ncbi:oocyte zinc finger protein XlCOF8.4-like [Stomoxys calcitrans]|uniref:oocyte zinc finger protein XlCOF8.4-like n=1 Tax=Stomoxys calcitrans TaxID=35570 RepID=UPI0027E30D91|nr:oocyte zinc finger protein XlCOF8.4-like [Stomoxys calcitrans]XP_059222331.1 oocyte zinc finger protein XlCOF8.4-like [Stomoxys calcitrans]